MFNIAKKYEMVAPFIALAFSAGAAVLARYVYLLMNPEDTIYASVTGVGLFLTWFLLTIYAGAMVAALWNMDSKE